MIFGLLLSVFMVLVIGFVFSVVFCALGLVFRLGFFALQFVGVLLGFMLFGGGLVTIVLVLAVLNLVGLPILCARGRR